MHHHDAGCFAHTFSFSTPCDDIFTKLVCATHWLYMHLYMLAYMSMHESCLRVCRPYFNTMKLWTFDPNQRLSLADIIFCLLSCLFTPLPVCLLASDMLCLSYLSRLFVLHPFAITSIYSFRCLSAGFLVFAFACTHMERGHTDLGRDLLGASKKGTNASMPT